VIFAKIADTTSKRNVTMTIADIRRTRKVPAKRGGRVRYYGSGKVQMGTIKSARSGYLRILLDGDKHMGDFHPTWELEYQDGSGNTLLDTRK
jgi:hypothetical protein